MTKIREIAKHFWVAKNTKCTLFLGIVHIESKRQVITNISVIKAIY